MPDSQTTSSASPSRFYYKGNPLKQLRAFVAVARNGSMTDAAQELFLSQSAVSLQIRALEEEMQTTLFERHGPRIQITEEGAALLDMARPLVEGFDSLKERFQQQVNADAEQGEVVIAAGESTIIYILPRLVAKFRKEHPNIHVHLRNVTGREGLEAIRNDEVDFAVGSMLDVPSDIGWTPLWSFAPTLITPPDHPLAGKTDISLEDISPYGLILPPRRLTTWRLVDRVFQQHRVPYNVVLEVGGWEVIKRYVEADFGISIVTSICLREEDRLAAHDMSRYFPKRSYGVVTRRGRHLPPAARAFVEAIGDVTMPRSVTTSEHSFR